MTTYEIIDNEEFFLKDMSFDSSDIEEMMELKENDKHHTLLVQVSEDEKTVSVTPSDADIHFYIIRNEVNQSIISETMDIIGKYYNSNDLRVC